MPLDTYKIKLATKKYSLPKEGVSLPTAKVEEKIHKRKIVFVCTGNTCRSPMAEYMLKHVLKQHKMTKYYLVNSAGLMAVEGSPISEKSLESLKKLGINGGAKHKARQFYASLVPKKDLIITMTSAHKLVIGNYFNVFSLDELTDCRDIQDPFGGSQKSYDSVAECLMQAINILFEKVIKIE